MGVPRCKSGWYGSCGGVWMRRTSMLAALTLSLWIPLAGAKEPAASSSLLNKAAPHLVLVDLSHRRFDLLSYRGKVVLLNFWATWCAPCQVEMPRFVSWQEEYRARGLQVVGISMDDDLAPVLKTYEKLHLSFPVAMGNESIGAEFGGVLGLPVTFLIDRHGKIRSEYRGETDLTKIETDLQRLLNE